MTCGAASPGPVPQVPWDQHGPHIGEAGLSQEPILLLWPPARDRRSLLCPTLKKMSLLLGNPGFHLPRAGLGSPWSLEAGRARLWFACIFPFLEAYLPLMFHYYFSWMYPLWYVLQINQLGC